MQYNNVRKAKLIPQSLNNIPPSRNHICLLCSSSIYPIQPPVGPTAPGSARQDHQWIHPVKSKNSSSFLIWPITLSVVCHRLLLIPFPWRPAPPVCTLLAFLVPPWLLLLGLPCWLFLLQLTPVGGAPQGAVLTLPHSTPCHSVLAPDLNNTLTLKMPMLISRLRSLLWAWDSNIQSILDIATGWQCNTNLVRPKYSPSQTCPPWPTANNLIHGTSCSDSKSRSHPWCVPPPLPSTCNPSASCWFYLPGIFQTHPSSCPQSLP